MAEEKRKGTMSWKSRGLESSSKSVVSRKLTLLLCIGCFCAGMLFTDRLASDLCPLLSLLVILICFDLTCVVHMLDLVKWVSVVSTKFCFVFFVFGYPAGYVPIGSSSA